MPPGWSGAGAAGEAGDGEIEAAPEEMDRADLAEEAGAEQAEDAVGGEQGAEQPPGAVRIVGARRASSAKGMAGSISFGAPWMRTS